MEQIDFIIPILEQFFREKKSITNQIHKDGSIPKELCQLCNGISKEKRWMIEPSQTEIQDIGRYIAWIRENQIVSISKPYGESVTVVSHKRYGQKRPSSYDPQKKVYNYYYYTYNFEKISPFTNLTRK